MSIQLAATAEAAEARFRAAFECAPTGMALLDAGDDDGGRVLLANEALCDVLGVTAEQLVGTLAQDRVAGPELLVASAELRRLRDRQAERVRFELPLRHAAGYPVWADVTAALLEQQPTGAVALVHVEDVTERRQFERRLRHVADRDPLTGLLNRRRFEEELVRQVKRSARYGQPASVLALDLDGLRAVNDSHGAQAGDAVLRAVAALLERRVRDTDVLARLAGDGFALMLPGTDESGARQLASDLVAAVREARFAVPGGEARLTVSAGVAGVGDRIRAADEVLADAEAALGAAQERGGDGHATFRPGTRAALALRAPGLGWGERVRDALHGRGLELHAQPVLDAADGTLRAYELLLRLEGDGGETVLPGVFLDPAERLGLVHDLDRWVLAQAARLVPRLASCSSAARLSVNLSPLAPADRELPAWLADRLADAGANPSRLVLELAETSIARDPERARVFATRMRRAGCAIAVDDFGAGLGSLASLVRLPFDELKVDGEFVRAAPSDADARAVVRAGVAIARGHGARAAAEHVEDDAILTTARACGVDLVPGYHLGEPRPVHDVLRA